MILVHEALFATQQVASVTAYQEYLGDNVILVRKDFTAFQTAFSASAMAVLMSAMTLPVSVCNVVTTQEEIIVKGTRIEY